jgi:protein arginine kinase
MSTGWFSQLPKWMNTAAETTVMSSRIRLARNVADLRFPPAADDREMNQVLKQVEAFGRAHPGWTFARIAGWKEIPKAMLVERGFIALESSGNPKGIGLAVTEDEAAAVVVNEEDHCRIQVMRGGLHLTAALEQARDIEQRLCERVIFAQHPTLGYLTTFPTNVGTGLRATTLLHLPALALTRELTEVLNAVVHVGLAVRGLYGQGTDLHSSFFQVGNQITLGRTEDEIVKHLEGVTRQVVERENKAREKLLRDQRVLLEDRVARALGILSSCRLLGMEEGLELVSTLVLGHEAGICSHNDRLRINELLLCMQPAHLQAKDTHILSAEDIALRRADLLRRRLKLKPIKL